ncbi:Luciferin 4-monooxygenase [Camponotus floridanus]|uniref:Luciferin 4-monooxygenase n=3 Tax=Camponotus floridanus TaxID=104421 RepID=E2AJF2_CAMFO|nr:luciferin 4-monooxygenase isoform X2 [Camponotus floridanus]EFN66473.1 Luciferin 4-monooxygenase [Camponotus floridanus]
MSRYHQVEKDATENQVPFKIINNILIGEHSSRKYLNIGDWILITFKTRPTFIGQIDAETGEEVTYEEMRNKSVKLAIWLQKQGIKKNDVITICINNRMRAYMPLLAGIYLNLIVNPWDCKYLEDEVRTLYFLLEHSPDVIFIDSENLTKLQTAFILTRSFDEPILSKIIVMDEPQEGLMSDKKDYDSLDSIINSKFDPSEIEAFKCAQHTERTSAVVMFSSNTSNYPGEAYIPYGLFLSHPNDETPIMKFNDVGLWYEPINWTYSLLLTIRAIISFVTAIKISTFNEENLCQIIEKYKVSWVFLKSSMCNKFDNTNVFKKYDVSSLKQMLFGDTAIIRQIHEGLIKSLPNVYITQVYGISEIGVIAYQRKTSKIGSSGYVNKNIRLMFIDYETRQPVSANTCGEIWCQAPNIIVANPQSKLLQSKYDLQRSNEGWYYTGDVGFFDEDGDIFVIDKVRDLIRYRNLYIYPRKIEQILLRHPDVHEVAVVGVKHDFDRQHAKAFVIREEGTKVTEKELIEFVKNNVDNETYFLHGGVSFLKIMPRLPNGRIDRMRVKYVPRENE